MNSQNSAAESTRKISVPLLIGIIFLPFIFSWFLLREGYSTVARVVALGWAAIALLALLTSGGDETQSAEVAETVAVAAENTNASKQAAEKPVEKPETNAPSEPEGHLNAEQNSDSKDEPEPEPEPEEKMPEYSADEISKAYADNTVAADRKFKGKRFIVTGVVSDVNTDFLNRVYFTFKNRRDMFSEPQFAMKRGHDDFAASVRKGQKIRLECTGDGDIVKTAMHKNCVPAP